MVTLFNVQSSRIRDINIPVGTTVGELRRHLKGKGLDVEDAFVAVNREQQQDRLVGENDRYRLLPGDTVEFATKEISLPNTARLAARDNEKAEASKDPGLRKHRIVVNIDLDDDGNCHVGIL